MSDGRESDFEKGQLEKITLNLKAKPFVRQSQDTLTHGQMLPRHRVVNQQTTTKLVTERAAAPIRHPTTASLTHPFNSRNPDEHARVTSPAALPVSSHNGTKQYLLGHGKAK